MSLIGTKAGHQLRPTLRVFALVLGLEVNVFRSEFDQTESSFTKCLIADQGGISWRQKSGPKMLRLARS